MPGSPAAFFLQETNITNIWDLFSHGTAFQYGILAVLLLASLYSWTVIFSKLSQFKSVRKSDARFLRAFRKAAGLEAVMVASEQFRPSPLVSVFEYGYQEVSRQVKARGSIGNPESITRSLQLGVSEQLSRLERNVNWLATTASVSPFIGLLGTVIGIIRAFQNLGQAGSTSLRSVGPGIADALIATAVGLFAAIPAAIFYNHFGYLLKQMGARMDDFSLEFMNLIERSFGN
ncbi:MAG TPA: MotA/TolQ/ExbB proton channel family protein [Bryobacteraceae bacterium]|nr:MotA/TolQ/ExbB proton channel family protein [Bryobacteraceae bacterium]